MCQPYIESASALSDIYGQTRLHYPARLCEQVTMQIYVLQRNDLPVCVLYCEIRFKNGRRSKKGTK